MLMNGLVTALSLWGWALLGAVVPPAGTSGKMDPAALTLPLFGSPSDTFATENTLAGVAATPDTLAADTLRFHLDRLVVTATRSSQRLAEAPAATSLLERGELSRPTVNRMVDALEQVPGMAILDFHGTGDDPQPVIRGFYGGGETEYLLLLLDGVPVTRLHDGRINWDLIPLAAVDRIEVVRGGLSPVWGDGALGGVVNLVTRRSGEAPSYHRVEARVGGVGLLATSGYAAGTAGSHAASVWGGLQRSDGFRNHSERKGGSAGASVDLLPTRTSRGLTLSTLHHWRDTENPGPLAQATLDQGASPQTTLPIFRFDGALESRHRLGLDGFFTSGGGSPGVRVSGHLVGEFSRLKEVRTLPLSPFFADSQERSASSRRVFGSGRAELPLDLGGVPGRLTVGFDLSLGRLENEYRGVLSGGPDAYESAPAGVEAGPLLAQGVGTRGSTAVFLQGELKPHPRLHLHAGLRRDDLRDRYTPAGEPAPTPEGEGASSPANAAALSSRKGAWSPSVGMNFLLTGAGGTAEGSQKETRLFASLSRSFRAATLDQLFDERAIPVPFPPYAITTSSPLLKPQRGIQGEAGLRYGGSWDEARVAVDASVAAFRMELRDQLDFDLAQFKYVNLGRSRQQGVELSGALRHASGSRLALGYTLQHAQERGEQSSGRQLKAVPRHTFTAGGSVVFVGLRGFSRPDGAGGPMVSVSVTRLGGIWLDDANRLPLESFARVDGGVSLPLGGLEVQVEVRNALNRRYASTGYPDPSGTATVYLHPAAGRTFQLGIATSAPSLPGTR